MTIRHLNSSTYVDDVPSFDAAPRAKRKKGMKQTRLMAEITTTSARANDAVVRIGCNSRKVINAMNNMLIPRSSPSPITYPSSLRRQSRTPPATHAGEIRKEPRC